MTIETPLGQVVIKAQANGTVSLRRGLLPRTIANGMTIDESVACVLSVNPEASATSIVFSAHLMGSEFAGDPATGESLDCIEWEQGDWHLTIGTEDQEQLSYRLPELKIPKSPCPISYSPSGMVLTLEDVPMHGENTFHMITSWKKVPDERECSAWFFADIPHEVANKAAQVEI